MIKLGPNQFEVPVPPAMRSFALQQRVLPVAGRLAGVLLAVMGRAADYDLAKLAERDVMDVLPIALPGIGDAMAALPAGELEALTRALLRGATADGILLFETSQAGDHFDALMRGRAVDTWRLLWHALGVWYPDFFALGSRRRAAPAPRESHSAA